MYLGIGIEVLRYKVGIKTVEIVTLLIRKNVLLTLCQSWDMVEAYFFDGLGPLWRRHSANLIEISFLFGPSTFCSKLFCSNANQNWSFYVNFFRLLPNVVYIHTKLWLSGKVVKNEKIKEIERSRVRSPPRATSLKKIHTKLPLSSNVCPTPTISPKHF
jgi:hypothetical protein